MEVFDDMPVVIVRFYGDGGRTFSLKFIQKPNPVGFMAKLPKGKSK